MNSLDQEIFRQPTNTSLGFNRTGSLKQDLRTAERDIDTSNAQLTHQEHRNRSTSA